MSNRFKTICRAFHMIFKPTSQGQPQADGMVKRVNYTILDIAAFVCKKENAKWSELVGEIEHATNTRTQAAQRNTRHTNSFSEGNHQDQPTLIPSTQTQQGAPVSSSGYSADASR